jgi:hypothetical protein
VAEDDDEEVVAVGAAAGCWRRGEGMSPSMHALRRKKERVEVTCAQVTCRMSHLDVSL